MASTLCCSAIVRAAAGTSHAPGTRTTSILERFAPLRKKHVVLKGVVIEDENVSPVARRLPGDSLSACAVAASARRCASAAAPRPSRSAIASSACSPAATLHARGGGGGLQGHRLRRRRWRRCPRRPPPPPRAWRDRGRREVGGAVVRRLGRARQRHSRSVSRLQPPHMQKCIAPQPPRDRRDVLVLDDDALQDDVLLPQWSKTLQY